MKYKKLRIKNYRGVESSAVEFESHGLTLVQGPNEVGKTSLGEAIGILFEYPDSSKHSAVVAIRPVHRDAGSEIELEAESGPYKFVYSKRFHKKPETKLKVTAPKPENHTGREAHDRAMEILTETLDINLWKALTIQQGVAIDQPDLANQQSLSAALDKAAGGIPTDQSEEGLFEKVGDEFARYFTAKGQEKSNLKQSREQSEQAQSNVDEIEGKLRELDQDTDSAARLQNELIQLRVREAALSKEQTEQSELLQEIASLESRVSEATLKLESAKKSAALASREWESRKELIKSVEEAIKEHQVLVDSSQDWIASFDRAEKELNTAQTAFQEVNKERKVADTNVGIRRSDFDYFNNLLFLEQLRERKQRVDEARRNAARAEESLANNKVDEETLKEIENLERMLLTAGARLESAAPSVKLRGLSEYELQIDGVESTIARDEVRELSVSDRLRLVIPDSIEIEVAAGSSIDQLTRDVKDAESAINSACREVSVNGPEAARAALLERQEASRKIEEKQRVEQESLRDLTYDDLADKLVRLEQTVPEYVANRNSETPIAADLSAAKAALEKAQAKQSECQENWETSQVAVDAARNVRDELGKEHETSRVNLRSLKKNLDQLQARLKSVRETETDDTLEALWKKTNEAIATDQANVGTAEESLKSKRPDKVKALAETAASSLATIRKRREGAQTELTEVQTRLKIHGEEGLHDKLQAAKTKLEKLGSENRSLLRRAAAAKRLFDIMRQERDKARQAYVAPLKDRIERLGRLVFDEAFQVELNENLQIVARTSGGITVPFESLSGGTKEQLSLIFRLACSMIVAEEGGMPLIMDDALGYTDPERLRLMGAVLAKAAKECQIVILTCVPDRYANIGEATIVSL